MVHTDVRHSDNDTSSLRGFSLVELIVVTAIFIVITSVVLAGNTRFGGKVLLQNLAYDMALSIREAQVYGISVRSFGAGSTAFSYGYGMYFQISDPPKYATSYVLFADAGEKDGLYDPCDGESVCPERVELTTLASGYRIVKLCSPRTPPGESSDSCDSVNRLDILFKRPEPDACIAVNGVRAVDPITGACTSGADSAQIFVQSPRGDTRSIVIEGTGQIAIQ